VQCACKGAEIKHAADKGENIKILGFKESVSWLWQFSKRRYIENTDRSTKGKAVLYAPTERDESLEKKVY